MKPSKKWVAAFAALPIAVLAADLPWIYDTSARNQVVVSHSDHSTSPFELVSMSGFWTYPAIIPYLRTVKWYSMVISFH